MMKLFEGGNVFKDADGNPMTQRINQSDVAQTVAWVETLTGIDFPRERWLGSTGRTPTSGDLDLAVDLSEVSKDALAAKAVEVSKREISMPEGPLYAIGLYEIEIQLHSDVIAILKVEIVPQK